jgi:hypothetical protein
MISTAEFDVLFVAIVVDDFHGDRGVGQLYFVDVVNEAL